MLSVEDRLLCSRIKRHAGLEMRREVYREERHAFDKERWRMAKVTVVNHYGGKCVCCGETNVKFLTIDHINGGGSRHTEKVGRGEPFYRWIIKNNYPLDLRILCWNCNCGRAKNGGICPHKEAV